MTEKEHYVQKNGIGRFVYAAERHDLPFLIDSALDSVITAREKTSKDLPIFVNFGECHEDVEPKVLQMGILSGLAQKYGSENIAFGMELPHNFLQKKAALYVPTIQPGLLQKIFEEHQNTQSTLNWLDGPKSKLGCAPLSYWTLFHFLAESKIRTHFNDLATCNSETFDLKDPITQRFLTDFQAHAVYEDWKTLDLNSVLADSHFGMVARNTFMKERALSTQKEHNPLIYVQHTGAAHSLQHAWKGGIYNYMQESITGLFRKAKHNIVTIVMNESPSGRLHPEEDWSIELVFSPQNSLSFRPNTMTEASYLQACLSQANIGIAVRDFTSFLSSNYKERTHQIVSEIQEHIAAHHHKSPQNTRSHGQYKTLLPEL